MDLQRSIISPIGNKARHLSVVAKNQLADIDTDALRARARQLAVSARDAALAANEAASPYLHKFAAASQQQLQALGDTIESNARAIAKRWSGKRNIVTRHPIAATLLAGSIGYLAYRAWQRARAQRLLTKNKRTPSKRAPRRTNAARANGAARSKQVHAARSTALN